MIDRAKISGRPHKGGIPMRIDIHAMIEKQGENGFGDNKGALLGSNPTTEWPWPVERSLALIK